MQRLSAHGLAEIKRFEGFVPFVYDDLAPVARHRAPHGYLPWDGSKPRGTLTIGYGHTDGAKHPLRIRQGLTVTEDEAEEILDVDLDGCEAAVRRLVKVPLTPGQFDALTSFEFNTGALGRSTLLRRLNRGDHAGVVDELKRYVFVTEGGVKRRLKGLENRRAMEIALWTQPAPAAEGDAEPTGTVIPCEPPGGPKPLSKSKTIWGAIVAGVATVASQAKDLAAELSGLADYAPAAGHILTGLVVLGIAWSIWGRLDVRREHDV